MNREEIIRMAREAGFPLNETSSRKFQNRITEIANAAYAAGAAAEREAARTKKYVPMTDAEWEKLYAEYEAICFDKSPSPRYIEAAVIRRAGLEVQE